MYYVCDCLKKWTNRRRQPKKLEALVFLRLLSYITAIMYTYKNFQQNKCQKYIITCESSQLIKLFKHLCLNTFIKSFFPLKFV